MRNMLTALLLAVPASAQLYTTPTPYCGGRLVAELFNTQVTPGPQGRVDYAMRLHNATGQALRFRVQVVGEMLNRPTGEFAIPPRAAAADGAGLQPEHARAPADSRRGAGQRRADFLPVRLSC